MWNIPSLYMMIHTDLRDLDLLYCHLTHTQSVHRWIRIKRACLGFSIRNIRALHKQQSRCWQQGSSSMTVFTVEMWLLGFYTGAFTRQPSFVQLNHTPECRSLCGSSVRLVCPQETNSGAAQRNICSTSKWCHFTPVYWENDGKSQLLRISSSM